MPKTNWENGFERYGVLRTCFKYTGREISDTSYHFFDNGDTHSEPGGACFTLSGSAPLALPVRPLTAMMYPFMHIDDFLTLVY